jgi:catechol 2,3-dioxygenase-like lactoylglutathione lyase family enzyme
MLTSLAITAIHVLDHDVALDFYVGKLGLEVHTDADLGFMRWITLNVPGEPDREIMLDRPGPPVVSSEIAEQARDLLTKGGAAGWLIFRTDDVHRTHADLKAKGVDLPEEPTQQSYGIDFGFRDPFGNAIRIGQVD